MGQEMKQFPLTEQMLAENEGLVKLLTEQHRYMQQCRLRAIDLAYSKLNYPDDGNALKKAKEIYEWLIEIIVAKPQ